MRNSRNETLSEHSLEVAMIAHALCVIGNTRYNRELDADKAALIGIYHDASEIITGDMISSDVKDFILSSLSLCVIKNDGTIYSK